MDDITNKEMLNEIISRLEPGGCPDVSPAIDAIYVLLKGNGNPSDGMVWKVNELYKWMGVHQIEHKAATAKAEKEKDARNDRKWDIIRTLINWIMPFVLFALARAIVNGGL